jgi:hypothetical protein
MTGGRGHVDPDILWRFCNEHRNKNSSVLKVSLLSKKKKKIQFRDFFLDISSWELKLDPGSIMNQNSSWNFLCDEFGLYKRRNSFDMKLRFSLVFETAPETCLRCRVKYPVSKS